MAAEYASKTYINTVCAASLNEMCVEFSNRCRFSQSMAPRPTFRKAGSAVWPSSTEASEPKMPVEHHHSPLKLDHSPSVIPPDGHT